MDAVVTGDELDPGDVLEELEQHDELVVELYARDVDGLPATIRRLMERAINGLPKR